MEGTCEAKTTAAVLTLRELADRWGCTERHIRNLNVLVDELALDQELVLCDARLLADLRQAGLPPLQGPLAGHDARILVGIGIPHHHLLTQPARTARTTMFSS